MNSAVGDYAAEGESWQARKSAQTRVAILESAIDCLGEQGYASTTTQMISDKAGISRGAMLHHYATKIDLIEATIDYIFWKRMKLFGDEIAALPERARIEEQQGLELLWERLQGREFIAQLELLIAARTDRDLKALYEPKAVEFNRAWSQEISNMFPEWTNAAEQLQLAIDFSQATLEGLVINRNVIYDRARRIAVRKLLSRIILMIRDGKLDIETD